MEHHVLFIVKGILLEENLWYHLTYIFWGKEVHAFPKVSNLKLNVINWREFELASLRCRNSALQFLHHGDFVKHEINLTHLNKRYQNF